MLDRHTASCFILHSPGNCGGENSREERIFREIFKVTSAERISLDVHAGRQPEVYMEFSHFFRNRTSELSEQFRIPCLCQGSAYRECRTVLIICIRVFVNFHWLQKSVFKRSENTGSVDGVCLLIDLITLSESKTGRSIRHDQRTDPVLLFQCLCCLPCRTGHADSGRSKCACSRCNVSVEKRNQILYRILFFCR